MTKENITYVVIACAPCDGGYHVVEIEDGDDEFAVERRYGGGIVDRFDTYEEAAEYASSKNTEVAA